MTPKEFAAIAARMKRARPNKLAAGLSATLERKAAMGKGRTYKTMDTARLAVHGTLDPLASTMRAVGKAKCPCCNGTGRAGYELTETGKRRLRKLRLKRLSTNG